MQVEFKFRFLQIGIRRVMHIKKRQVKDHMQSWNPPPPRTIRPSPNLALTSERQCIKVRWSELGKYTLMNVIKTYPNFSFVQKKVDAFIHILRNKSPRNRLGNEYADTFNFILQGFTMVGCMKGAISEMCNPVLLKITFLCNYKVK